VVIQRRLVLLERLVVPSQGLLHLAFVRVQALAQGLNCARELRLGRLQLLAVLLRGPPPCLFVLLQCLRMRFSGGRGLGLQPVQAGLQGRQSDHRLRLVCLLRSPGRLCGCAHRVLVRVQVFLDSAHRRGGRDLVLLQRLAVRIRCGCGLGLQLIQALLQGRQGHRGLRFVGLLRTLGQLRRGVDRCLVRVEVLLDRLQSRGGLCLVSI